MTFAFILTGFDIFFPISITNLHSNLLYLPIEYSFYVVFSNLMFFIPSANRFFPKMAFAGNSKADFRSLRFFSQNPALFGLFFSFLTVGPVCDASCEF